MHNAGVIVGLAALIYLAAAAPLLGTSYGNLPDPILDKCPDTIAPTFDNFDFQLFKKGYFVFPVSGQKVATFITGLGAGGLATHAYMKQAENNVALAQPEALGAFQPGNLESPHEESLETLPSGHTLLDLDAVTAGTVSPEEAHLITGDIAKSWSGEVVSNLPPRTIAALNFKALASIPEDAALDLNTESQRAIYMKYVGGKTKDWLEEAASGSSEEIPTWISKILELGLKGSL
ncbi:MAG: hypothetical protein M1829_000479 [Trizodia sp. TS-e1964]|nr:MAG: hypothetical protein M1829_000479 [Trizodia sp. TS-e1964]